MKFIVFFATLLSLLFCSAAQAVELDSYSNIKSAQVALMKHKRIAGCGTKSRPCRTEYGFQRANAIVALSCNGGETKIVRLFFNKKTAEGYRFWRGPRNNNDRSFSVVSPQGCAVLAIRSAVRSGNGFKETVYTPYSSMIDTPAMRARGMKYLTSVISQAQAELSRRGVLSQAFEGGLVADTAPTQIAAHLALVEHVDPKMMRNSNWNIGEVLVVLAANGPNAFQRSVSSANAIGLFQVTQGTYNKLRERYADAGLNPDFVAGSQNHVNAAKAALLLFDSDIAALPKRKRETLVRNEGAHAEYLAAAYNGGSTRAKLAMGGDLRLRANLLVEETRGYLRKLKRVSVTIPRIYAYRDEEHFGA